MPSAFSFTRKEVQHLNVVRGMTLLELLVVVALLSIVALAATSLIVDTGEWKQQQLTEDQWLATKRAIVGDNVVDAHYRREYSGFVVDMGRLPRCLRELIRPYDCGFDLYSDETATADDDASRLTSFTQDIGSNQWHGWRGPYLGIPGANEYRDGWRNQGRTDNTGNDDDVNYGWLFGTGAAAGTECQNAVVEQQQPGTLILQSCGDDEDVDPTETGFQADYPYVEADGSYVPLITRHDYQVDLGTDWVDAPVKVKSRTVGSSRIIPVDDLRLRLNYPVTDGRIPDWGDALIATSADRDLAPFLSATFPVSATRVVDGSGKVYTGQDTDSDFLTDGAGLDVTVPLGTTLSGTLMVVPDSISSTLVFDSGNSVLQLQNCPCDLEVDAGSLTTATNLNGANTIAIEPENIAPITADLGKYVIEVPDGASSTPGVITLPNGQTLSVTGGMTDDYFPKIMLDPSAVVNASSADTDMEGDLAAVVDENGQFLMASASTVSGALVTVEKAVATVPIGMRNITIVCESDGLLYDGDCSDNPSTYTPIATPYQLEVSPRAYVPAPNEILWNIE